MRKLGMAVPLLLAFLLVGCGSNGSGGSNINGKWSATLLGSNNAPTVFDFATSLTVNSDGSLTVVNFNFSSNSPCFVSGQTESGSIVLSGNFGGQVNGTFSFVVQSGSPAGNTLTLTGMANGNQISGQWKLTGGTGCTGSGNFTMTRM